jgi:hypothetical protein
MNALALCRREGHDLRIPFMVALRDHGFQVTAAGIADPTPSARSDLEYHPFRSRWSISM